MIYLIIPPEIAGFPYKKGTNISGLGKEEAKLEFIATDLKVP